MIILLEMATEFETVVAKFQQLNESLNANEIELVPFGFWAVFGAREICSVLLQAPPSSTLHPPLVWTNPQTIA